METISIKRAEKIARNINAMNLHFQRMDDFRKYRFWETLNKKLREILKTLSEDDKQIIKSLCKEEKAQFFNLV